METQRKWSFVTDSPCDCGAPACAKAAHELAEAMRRREAILRAAEAELEMPLLATWGDIALTSRPAQV